MESNFSKLKQQINFIGNIVYAVKGYTIILIFVAKCNLAKLQAMA